MEGGRLRTGALLEGDENLSPEKFEQGPGPSHGRLFKVVKPVEYI